MSNWLKGQWRTRTIDRRQTYVILATGHNPWMCSKYIRSKSSIDANFTKMDLVQDAVFYCFCSYFLSYDRSYILFFFHKYISLMLPAVPLFHFKLEWNFAATFSVPVHLINFCCLISGENGTIDGQGKMWWDLWWNRTLVHTRGHLVELINSQNVLIQNLTLLNSPFWTIHPVYCRFLLSW